MKDNPNNKEKREKSNLHKGHRNRVKELYKNVGIDGLPPHVVLELLLFFAIPYKDTNEISHQLINKFGSISSVFEADTESLKSVKNMTHNAALLINLVSDISKKYRMSQNMSDEKINTINKVKSYLISKLEYETVEKVYLLLFDNNNCMVHIEPITEGGISVSEISVGNIVKKANVRGIKRIALAHNHPDDAPVSTNDIVTTKKVAYHLKSVDVELWESFVITQGKAVGIFEMINGKLK